MAVLYFKAQNKKELEKKLSAEGYFKLDSNFYEKDFTIYAVIKPESGVYGLSVMKYEDYQMLRPKKPDTGKVPEK